MQERTKRALLARGFSGELIIKIRDLGETVSSLRGRNLSQLKRSFTDEEAHEIASKVGRKPIPKKVVDSILTKADSSCALCANGHSSGPYELNHIEEHSASQDDTEGNLILVCPNHHALITKGLISEDEQRSAKRRWHCLVEIAGGYRERGLAFPYCAFEALDFEGEPTVSEVLTLGGATPRGALALASHALADEGLRILGRFKSLVITGNSGAGKSTLAEGIAGRLSTQGVKVFRYRYPGSASSVTGEVAMFISLCVTPTIVLLDDINLRLLGRSSEVSQLLSSSRPSCQIIATIANQQVKEWQAPIEIPAERDFAHLSLYVSWPKLRATTLEYIANNLTQIEELLLSDEAAYGFASSSRVDFFDTLDWHERVHALSSEAKTAWQFIFLARSGALEVDRLVTELADRDNAHAVVLAAALQGIASEGDSANSREIAHDILGDSEGEPGPELIQWITDILDGLCDRRRFRKTRGRYAAVHHYWAGAFVCACLANLDTEREARRQLDRCFLPGGDPVRMYTVWAELSAAEHLNSAFRSYMDAWLEGLDDDDWSSLLQATLAEGIYGLAFLASRLYDQRPYRASVERVPGDVIIRPGYAEWRDCVERALGRAGTLIQEAIPKTRDAGWAHLSSTTAALHDAWSMPVWDLPVWEWVESWDPAAAARSVASTRLVHYGSVASFFQKAREKAPEWSTAVGDFFDPREPLEELRNLERGQLRPIFDLHALYRTQFGLQLGIQQLLAYLEAMTRVLDNPALTDIRCSTSYIPELEILGEKSAKPFEGLDPERIAGEFLHEFPRISLDFVALIWLAKRLGSTFPQDMVSELDIEALGGRARQMLRADWAKSPLQLQVAYWLIAQGRGSELKQFEEHLGHPEGFEVFMRLVAWIPLGSEPHSIRLRPPIELAGGTFRTPKRLRPGLALARTIERLLQLEIDRDVDSILDLIDDED